jgi:hypothetical protein
MSLLVAQKPEDWRRQQITWHKIERPTLVLRPPPAQLPLLHFSRFVEITSYKFSSPDLLAVMTPAALTKTEDGKTHTNCIVVVVVVAPLQLA